MFHPSYGFQLVEFRGVHRITERNRKGTEMNRKEPKLPKGTERNRKDHELPKGKGPHL